MPARCCSRARCCRAIRESRDLSSQGRAARPSAGNDRPGGVLFARRRGRARSSRSRRVVPAGGRAGRRAVAVHRRSPACDRRRCSAEPAGRGTLVRPRSRERTPDGGAQYRRVPRQGHRCRPGHRQGDRVADARPPRPELSHRRPSSAGCTLPARACLAISLAPRSGCGARRRRTTRRRRPRWPCCIFAAILERRDVPKAEELLRQAVESGHVGAAMQLASSLPKVRRRGATKRSNGIRKAAEAGHAEAQLVDRDGALLPGKARRTILPSRRMDRQGGGGRVTRKPSSSSPSCIAAAKGSSATWRRAWRGTSAPPKPGIASRNTISAS